jgi:RTA1 like protein
LTIGPTFFTASIYLCLARIIVIFGEDLARLRPRTYTIAFVCSDVLSLILQALGGGKASQAKSYATKQVGIHIMVAGLVLQVVSLVVFLCLCAGFAYSVHRSPSREDPLLQNFRTSLKFKAFVWGMYSFIDLLKFSSLDPDHTDRLLALGFTTLLILIRSSFRVAELSEGFGSALANNEVTFMVLEGGMVALAVILLTVMHPGVVFGRKGWKEAGWSFSGKPIRKSDTKEKLHPAETPSQ